MLKKIYILLSIISISSFAYTQNIKGVFILGSNLSQIEGDRVFSWTFGYNKIGLNTGLAAIVSINEKFSLNLETLYSELGSYQGAKYKEDTFSVLYKTNLNYVEIPFFLNFFDKKGKMNFGLGVIFGKLVSAEEWVYDVKSYYPPTELPWTSWDYRWLANFYIGIYKNFKLNFRYSYSLRPIRYKEYSDGEIWTQFNQVISIRAMWIFNEKKVNK